MVGGNLYQQIPNNLDKEHFQTLAGSNNVKIECIVSKGHRSPETGWYDQENSEWVVVLQGAAIIELDDGNQIELKPGDYVEIPARQRHKVSWTDPNTETIWLAVHY